MTPKRKSLPSSTETGRVKTHELADSSIKFTRNYPMTRSKTKLLSSSKASPSANTVRTRPKARTKRLTKRPRPEQKERTKSESSILLNKSFKNNTSTTSSSAAGGSGSGIGSKRQLGSVRTNEAAMKKRRLGPSTTPAPVSPSTSTDNSQQRSSARLAAVAANQTISPTTSATTAIARTPTMSLRSSSDSHITAAANLISSVPITYPSTRVIVQSSQMQTSATRRLFSSSASQPLNVRCFDIGELKLQLKKATSKFNKACHQLVLLDQHMNDLQHSYSSSLENDRKTFKIVYRMQLATLEGTHNAYIEYIERQVERIKRLKRILFNNHTTANTNVPTSSSSNASNSTAVSTVNSSNPATATLNSNTNNSNNQNYVINNQPFESSSADRSASTVDSSVNIPIIINVDRQSNANTHQEAATVAGALVGGASASSATNNGNYLISVTSDEEDTDDDDDDDDDDLFANSGHLFAGNVNSAI